jgi:hypothetical protein
MAIQNQIMAGVESNTIRETKENMIEITKRIAGSVSHKTW